MPWKGREWGVFFVLLPNSTFLATRWNSKRIMEILTQRQKVISHPDLMVREYVLIRTTLILIGPVTFGLHLIWRFIRFVCQKMLFHLHFTEETVQLRLMVGKLRPWCQSSFFFLETFPAREREIEWKYPHLAQITKSLSFPYFTAQLFHYQFKFFLDQSKL